MFNPFGALSGFAGGIPQGYDDYQNMRVKQMQRQKAENEIEDAKLFGEVFQSFGLNPAGQAALPGATPMPPMPGQASVPMQRPSGQPQIYPQSFATPAPSAAERAQGVVHQGVFNPIDAAMLQPSRAGGMPALPGQPPGTPSWAPGEPPLPPSGAPVRTDSMTAPGAPPMPGQPQQPAPGGAAPPGQPQQPTGTLSWQAIARRVAELKPNARPEIIAGMVSRFLPVMTAQSQMDWRTIQQQFQAERIDSLNRHRELTDLYRDRRQTYLESGAGAVRGSSNPLHIATQQFIKERTEAGTPPSADEIVEFAQKAAAKPTRAPTSPDAIAMAQFVTEKIEATGKPPSADEMSKFRRELRTSTVQENKAIKETAAGVSVINQIDDTIRQVEESLKGAGPLVGLLGKGRRYYEGIAGNLDREVGTAAKDFETSIALIKNQLPRLLSGSTRIARDERDDLNKIIRGLDPFESPSATISALKRVRKVIMERDPSLLGGGGAAAPTAGKPITAQIRKDFEASLQGGTPRAQMIEYLRSQGYKTDGL